MTSRSAPSRRCNAAKSRAAATTRSPDGESTSIAAHPWYLAGTGRFDTAIAEVTAGRVLSKIGTDGMHLAMAPHAGLAVAAKAVDGSRIAAEEGLVHLLVQSGALNTDEAERLPRASVLDDAGRVVGAISVSAS